MKKQLILLILTTLYILILCGISSAAYPSDLHINPSGNELNNKSS